MPSASSAVLAANAARPEVSSRASPSSVSRVWTKADPPLTPSAYSPTKFAVRGFTQAAAQELAPYNITVNGYAPGIVDTPMWTFIDEEMSKLNGKPLGQNFKDMVDTIALKRCETPDDVAGVVSFLVCDIARYVTGQTVIVDGGMQYR